MNYKLLMLLIMMNDITSIAPNHFFKRLLLIKQLFGTTDFLPEFKCPRTQNYSVLRIMLPRGLAFQN